MDILPEDIWFHGVAPFLDINDVEKLCDFGIDMDVARKHATPVKPHGLIETECPRYIIRCMYRNGKRDGICEVFLKGAGLWSRSTYVDNMLHGEREDYDLFGNMCSRAVFVNGCHILSEDFCLGNRVSRSEYLYGSLNGLMQEWFINGQKKLHMVFRNDAAHGVRYEWFSNGKLKRSAKYLYGLPVGAYVENYKTGRPKVKAYYKDALCLRYKSWYYNGAVKRSYKPKSGIYTNHEWTIRGRLKKYELLQNPYSWRMRQEWGKIPVPWDGDGWL